MNAIVIEGKEYHFKMAHPENTEEITVFIPECHGNRRLHLG